MAGIVDRWSASNITDSTSERRLVGRWCAREWVAAEADAWDGCMGEEWPLLRE